MQCLHSQIETYREATICMRTRLTIFLEVSKWLTLLTGHKNGGM